MKKLTLISCTLGLLISQAASATEAPLQGALKKIADSGSITLGYRDASVPFSYVGDNTGKPMGYSVDLANKIVENVQKKLGIISVCTMSVLIPPKKAFGESGTV